MYQAEVTAGLKEVVELLLLPKGASMRVLVAGHGGYIGAVLVPLLQGAGHQVDGYDLGLYEGCDLGPARETSAARPPRDIRTAESPEPAGFGAGIWRAGLATE